MAEERVQGEGVSRREWLRRAPLPAMAMAMGAGVLQAEAPKALAVDLGARVYNIRSFGAKGDGVAMDTTALQAAIDACTHDGGGTVLVPAGKFQIGTVELKSNVTLQIAAGGTLLGSGDGKQYHAVDAIPLHGDTTLVDGNWALLFAVKAKNVSIVGPGTIDGQGAMFHAAVRGQTPPSGLGGNKRPYHVLAYQCENLAIRDVSLLDCAYHSVRIIQSQRVHLDGIYIHNRVNGNNDGFHFISAEHVTMSNCTVKSQDDACAMFGSCRFITITNSTFSTRWSVFRFGGGTAENIAVSNCVLYEVDGCPIKFQGDPGSRFQDISFSNLVLSEVTGPISISVGGKSDAAKGVPPVLVRRISFSNIHGTVTTNPPQLSESTLTSGSRPGELHSCIVLNCVNDATLEEVSFDNVHLTFGGGGTAEDAARRELPQVFGEYFELGPMPAYGMYARNVSGLTLSNVRMQVASQELRPAIMFDNVRDVAVSGLSVQGDAAAESVLRMSRSRDVLLTAPRLLTKAAVFLQVEGAGSSGIKVEGGDLAKAAAPLALKQGASEDAVQVRG